MFAYLRKPHTDLASVILRLGLGFVFVAHGYIKVRQTLPMTEVMSYNLQRVVGWTELVCGIVLILGFLSRLAAAVLVADMIGAIVLVTGKRDFISLSVGPHGFTFSAAGFEYNLMIIVAALAVIAIGSGWFSVDHFLFARKRRATAPSVPVAPSPQAQPANLVSAP